VILKKLKKEVLWSIIDLTIQDSQLKSLVSICKKTKNYDNITIVGMVLISKMVNVIGINLAIRPREKDTEEFIYAYMLLINKILKKSVKIPIFEEELIEEVKNIEFQIVKGGGKIPKSSIRNILIIYYKIRTIEVPNLHGSISEGFNEPISSNIKFCSKILNSGNNKASQANSLEDFILHELNEQQKELENVARTEGYNKGYLENALFLKSYKNKVKNQNNKKVKITGKLKENINYQQSIEGIVGYLLLGIIALIIMILAAIIWEASIYPFLTLALSPMLIIFFGFALLLGLFYWNYFFKEQ